MGLFFLLLCGIKRGTKWNVCLCASTVEPPAVIQLNSPNYPLVLKDVVTVDCSPDEDTAEMMVSAQRTVDPEQTDSHHVLTSH